MRKIKLYTREADDKGYSKDLANAVHIAYENSEGEYIPFNKNYGILYGTSPIDYKNTIVCKGIKNPSVVKISPDEYMISAIPCDNNTGTASAANGMVAVWTTKDFVSYSAMNMIYLNSSSIIDKVHVGFNGQYDRYDLTWQDTEGRKYINSCKSLPDGAEMSSPVLIDDDTEIKPCDEIEIEDDVFEKMKIMFSSGNKEIQEKNKLTGTFPLATGWADPQIFKWEGKYYFIATNDNNGNIGLFVRESQTLMGLFEKAEPVLILEENKEKKLIQNFWAPEFHIIDGKLYILFAVSGEEFGPQCHMMKLKEGGNIGNINDWEEPVRVKKQDGSYLADKGITLDMTYFEAGGLSYLCWSYREHIFSEFDTGSMLYIATIDKDNPYILTSEPVLLSRPLWGWENTEGTINNEGPFALVREGKVYLAFSGGSACGYSYATGLLIADENDDLLDIMNWYKKATPIHTSYTIDGEYGPGHNSFFTDDEGNVYIVYHAKEALFDAPRCTGVKLLGFHENGEPYIM